MLTLQPCGLVQMTAFLSLLCEEQALSDIIWILQNSIFLNLCTLSKLLAPHLSSIIYFLHFQRHQHVPCVRPGNL